MGTHCESRGRWRNTTFSVSLSCSLERNQARTFADASSNVNVHNNFEGLDDAVRWQCVITSQFTPSLSLISSRTRLVCDRWHHMKVRNNFNRLRICENGSKLHIFAVIIVRSK